MSKGTHVAPNLREEEEGRQTEREGDVLSQFVTGRASAANERTSLPPIVASTSSSSCIICDSNLEMYHLAPLILMHTASYCHPSSCPHNLSLLLLLLKPPSPHVVSHCEWRADIWIKR